MVCDDIFVTSSGEMKLNKPVHTVRKNGRKDFLLLYVCDGTCEFLSVEGKKTQKKAILFFIIRKNRRTIIFLLSRSIIIYGFISAAKNVVNYLICWV